MAFQHFVVALLVLLPAVTYSLPLDESDIRDLKERVFEEFIKKMMDSRNKKQSEDDKFEEGQDLARKECMFNFSLHIKGHI